MITVPGYEVVAVLREGRTTVILRARRAGDRRPVIIKTSRRDHPSLRDIARLRHEHAMLARFDDDAVVRTLDLVVTGTRAAIVLEDASSAPSPPSTPPACSPIAASR